MGLHLPGTAFVNPGTALRDALTRASAHRACALAREGKVALADVIDERAIVNGVVGLMATGGSTNHALHIPPSHAPPASRSNGKISTRSSEVTPLLARIYPNGSADVNHFHAAGGMAFLVRELLDAGLLHDDTTTVAGDFRSYAKEPGLEDGKLVWRDAAPTTLDRDILRPASDPFDSRRRH